MIGCGGVRSRQRVADIEPQGYLDRQPVRWEVTLRAAKLYGYELPEGGLPRTVAELERRKRADMKAWREAGCVRMTPAGYGRLAVWYSGEKVARFVWSGDSYHPVRVVR